MLTTPTIVSRGATTVCSRCRGPLDAHRWGKQRYCSPCHAAYMREARTRRPVDGSNVELVPRAWWTDVPAAAASPQIVR